MQSHNRFCAIDFAAHPQAAPMHGLRGVVAIFAILLLLLGPTGCGDPGPSTGTGPTSDADGDTSEPITDTEPRPAYLEVDNPTGVPLDILSYETGRLQFTVAPFQVHRHALTGGPVALVSRFHELPDDEEDPNVADGPSADERVSPGSPMLLRFQPAPGVPFYVWDPSRRSTFARIEWPGGSVGSPPLRDPGGRYQFREADYGLLDPYPTDSVIPGRAPRRIRKLAKILSTQQGALRRITNPAELEAVVFLQPQAYHPHELAQYVRQTPEVFPATYAARLYDLMPRVPGIVRRSIVATLRRNPSITLVTPLLAQLTDPERLSDSSSDEARMRRDLVTIFADSGANLGDLRQVWAAVSAHADSTYLRQQVINGLKESMSLASIRFFLERLRDEESSDMLRATARERLLRADALRSEETLNAVRAAIQEDQSAAEGSGNTWYARLVQEALLADLQARQRGQRSYSDETRWWLMEAAATLLDIGMAAQAIEWILDQPGDRVIVVGAEIIDRADPRVQIEYLKQLVPARNLLRPEVRELYLRAVRRVDSGADEQLEFDPRDENDRPAPTEVTVALQAALYQTVPDYMRYPEHRQLVRSAFEEIGNRMLRRESIARWQTGWRQVLASRDLRNPERAADRDLIARFRRAAAGADPDGDRLTFDEWFERLEVDGEAELERLIVEARSPVVAQSTYATLQRVWLVEAGRFGEPVSATWPKLRALHGRLWAAYDDLPIYSQGILLSVLMDAIWQDRAQPADSENTQAGVAPAEVRARLLNALAGEAKAEDPAGTLLGQVAFELLMRDPVWFGEPEVRLALSRAVDGVPGDSPRRELRRRLLLIREAREAAIPARTSPPHLEFLARLVESPDREIAFAAIGALERCGTPEALALLELQAALLPIEARSAALVAAANFSRLPTGMFRFAGGSLEAYDRLSAVQALLQRRHQIADPRLDTLIAMVVRSEPEPELRALFQEWHLRHISVLPGPGNDRFVRSRDPMAEAARMVPGSLSVDSLLAPYSPSKPESDAGPAPGPR